MLQFCSLYSGSSGNSLLVQSENTKILIDVGESGKKIENALNNKNINISDIDAILITHEHTDHTKSLGTISKKFNIPVYANSKTWDAIGTIKEKIQKENKNEFNINETFEIGDIKISPFSIPHDAADPCGFNLTYNDKTISIATDLGHIDYNLIKNLDESSFIFLESNYDLNILKCSKYPYMLKQRISGPKGHLSNDNAAKAISYLLSNGLNNVMLGHLSKENNFPELAYQTVFDEICTNNNFNENSFKLSVATRNEPSNIIDI